MIEYNVIVEEDGTHYWYNQKGKLHREDGPAIEYADGDESWYIDGKLHREDGPAIEWSDNYKEWYLNGKKLTEKEFIKGEAMSHEIDSISIRGLRKAHLVQLASYIRARDSIGEQWYSGYGEHFEARHADLLALAEKLERIAANNEIVIASNAGNESTERSRGKP